MKPGLSRRVPDRDMHLDSVRQHLESLDAARGALAAWGLRDPERGWRNLRHLGESLTPEGLRELWGPLARLLPRTADLDMALNNLERFLANPAAAEALPQLLETRARALEILLQLFSTSHSFSDLLALNPDYLDMLRVPLRRSPGPAELLAALRADVDSA